MFIIDKYKNNLTAYNLGRTINSFDELESTNSQAWELIKENTPNGTIVVTENQTIGRGRQSNKWISVPGKSLTFSIILYPNCSISLINQYSVLTGLALADTLSSLNFDCQLKWPNDLLINNKKVGGILCESRIQSNNIKSLVIGIGINVNEEKIEFPPDLRKNATSLKIVSEQYYQLEEVLAKFINNFENRINQFDTFDLLINDWLKYCAHLNQRVSFHAGNKIISGYFKGLTDNAQAILLIDDIEQYFDSGVIVS